MFVLGSRLITNSIMIDPFAVIFRKLRVMDLQSGKTTCTITEMKIYEENETTNDFKEVKIITPVDTLSFVYHIFY